MRNKLLGVAAVSFLVAAGAAAPSDAGSAESASSAKPSIFKSTVRPSKGVKPGTVLRAKSTNAKPSTAYYCVIAAYSMKSGHPAAPDKRTLKVVKSSRTGKLSCKATYRPFKAKGDGSSVYRHCPTTAADRRAGYKCGVALADQATIGAVSASVARFYPVK